MSNQNPKSGSETKDSQEKKEIKIDASKIYTPHGSRQDVLNEINSLYRELEDIQRKGKQKYEEHIEKKGKQIYKSFVPNVEEDVTEEIPIDGDFITGSRVFMRFCASCHTLEANSQVSGHIGGPGLGLIYGRKAGSDRFFNYRDSYINSQKIWTEKNLFQYLVNPKKEFSDSRCEIPGGGLKSESDRADLIRFLRLYTKNLRINMDIKAKQVLGPDYVDTYKTSQRNVNERYFKNQFDNNKNS